MRETEFNVWWSYGTAFFGLFLRMLFDVRVEGIEHLPVSGPVILAFNHVSVLDGPAIAIETGRRRRRELRFLIAAEMFRRPVLGWILRTYHQIPIRRGEGDAGALDEAMRSVSNGTVAAIAPEGRVNDDLNEGLQRLHRGLARIALQTKAPVIPMAVWGTQIRWPRSGLSFRQPLRPTLVMAFAEPLLPRGDGESVDDVEALTAEVRRRLETQVKRARAIADRRV